MRLSSLALPIAALTLVNGLPQDIDFDLVEALPNPSYVTTVSSVSFDPTAALQSAMTQITASASDEPSTTATMVKRDTACQPQPAGATGAPSVATAPASFAADANLASAALNAATPSGYTQTFRNLNASSNAYGYMGFKRLDSYNVQACADSCQKINGCMSFNIYFERDPSMNPAATCPNPSPVTYIKCVFWGGPVNTANALNYGQYREQFQVVIAGSNGYQNNSIATPAGYTAPTYLGNAAINAPLDAYGFNTFLGSAVFTTSAFSVGLCAAACTAKSDYARAHPPTDGSPIVTCQFFNTYILYINTTQNLQGQYCAMYSESWPSKFATNVGQYRGSDHYLIQFSYSSSNATNPGPACHDCAVRQASKDISYSTLQPYCSSLLGYTTPMVTSITTTSVVPESTITSSVATTTTALTTVLTTTTVLMRRDMRVRAPDRPLIPVSSDAPTNAKRAASPVLTQYPSDVVSSACSLQATPVATTSTVSLTSTTTLPASLTTTTTTYTTAIISSTVTTTTSTTTTSSTVTSACGATSTSFPFDRKNNCGCSYNPVCGQLTGFYCTFDGGKQSSFGACANRCDFFANCYEFTFNPTTGDCRLCTALVSPVANPDYVSGVRGNNCVDSTCNYSR